MSHPLTLDWSIIILFPCKWLDSKLLHFINPLLKEMQSLLTKNCKLFCLYIYLFLRLKPVECIECQKNKQEDKLFRIVLKVVFITTEANLTYPNLLQTSNLISWLFVFCSFFMIFDFSFVSFYIYKSSVNSFMWIYAFKRKKLWGNVCLQPRRYMSISLHFFPPTGKFPFMHAVYFAGDKNVAFDFSE